jgi:hypothetical protein
MVTDPRRAGRRVLYAARGEKEARREQAKELSSCGHVAFWGRGPGPGKTHEYSMHLVCNWFTEPSTRETGNSVPNAGRHGANEHMTRR